MTDDRWLYAWGLGSIAFGAASLLVPLYVVGLGGGPVELGILAASAAGIGAPGAILVGRLADRAGHRRRIVVGSLALVAVLLLALPAVASITVVIVVNAALWLVSASVAPVLTMLVIDGVAEPNWNRRIARLNTFQGYGWAGGLVLGTVWIGAGSTVAGLLGGGALAPERTLFLTIGAAAAVSAIVAARVLPREVPTEERSRSRADVRRVARIVSRTRRNVKGATFAFSPNRLFWTTRGLDPRRLLDRFTPALGVYFLAAGLFSVGFAAFWAPLPAFLVDPAGLGLDSGSVFACYLASSLGSAVLYGPAGSASSSYDARYLQAGALSVRAASFVAVPALALAALGSLGTLVGGLAVLGLVGATWAVIAITATGIVTRLAPASLRGEVLGVYTAVVALAGGLGGLLGGGLAAASFTLAIGAASGLVLVGAGLVLALRWIQSRTAAAGQHESSDPANVENGSDGSSTSAASDDPETVPSSNGDSPDSTPIEAENPGVSAADDPPDPRT